MSMAARLLAIVGALALAGCSAGPDFKLPRFDLGSHWLHGDTQQQPVMVGNDWWTRLGDPVLNDLVARALEQSPSLKVAEARVVQARAQRRAALAGFLPTVSADGNAQYAERSENTSTYAGGNRQGNLFTAGFDASWELDIFGGQRRTAEAAKAELAASHADLDDARMTLAADVVATYMDYRLAEQREMLAAANVQTQERTVSLTEVRYQVGDVNGLDRAQAEAQMAATRAQLPLMRQMKELARGTLAVLVNAVPTTFVVSDTMATASATVPDVYAGLPSTLIERRPDVRAAEERLHAATARIGEAEALRLPTFSLTAAAGTQSSQLTNLLANGSGFWNLTPAGALVLFDGGARRAEVALRKGEEQEAAATYRYTVLDALRDVESKLVNLHEDRLRLDDLQLAAASSDKSFNLAHILYQQGEQNLLPVLQAQGSVFSAQDQYAQAQAQVVKDWVALIKALGGGYASSTVGVVSATVVGPQ
ncbi:MAG: efflux transporter outer membrane subunit [Proteobacteria bacterium]|nr:efflux transporter outer membrane subunit [Pseudomonadota bacterium]